MLFVKLRFTSKHSRRVRQNNNKPTSHHMETNEMTANCEYLVEHFTQRFSPKKQRLRNTRYQPRGTENRAQAAQNVATANQEASHIVECSKRQRPCHVAAIVEMQHLHALTVGVAVGSLGSRQEGLVQHVAQGCSQVGRLHQRRVRQEKHHLRKGHRRGKYEATCTP